VRVEGIRRGGTSDLLAAVKAVQELTNILALHDTVHVGSCKEEIRQNLASLHLRLAGVGGTFEWGNCR